MQDSWSSRFNMIIQIKKLNDSGIMPTRGSDSSAGYDLYSTEDYVLAYGERRLFKTGISMKIPDGYYGRIAPRSGLAYKEGLDTMAGVIDSDYLGDIGVILINLKKEYVKYEGDKHAKLEGVPVEITKGMRIGQIIFEKHHEVYFHCVDELEQTSRGKSGLGSTGTH